MALLFLSNLWANLWMPVTLRARLAEHKADGRLYTLDQLSDSCLWIPAYFALGWICLFVLAGGAPDVLQLRPDLWPFVLAGGFLLTVLSFVAREFVDRREVRKEKASDGL